MTNEQFNKLTDLLRQIAHLVKDAGMMTDSVFQLFPTHKKVGRAIVCKIAEDLGKAWDLFFEIGDLLKNVKIESEMETNAGKNDE